MIQARHTRFHSWFFKWYSRLMIRRHFRGIQLHGDTQDEGGALLVIGNHFSWWDGFFMVEVNRRLWRRRFHVMMLEEQLKRRMFLKKTGAFSIRKGHRSAIESLNYAAGLLSDPTNLVLMFPQGEIQSQHRSSFTFEKGVENMLSRSVTMPRIVFTAALPEYFSHPRPRLHIFIERQHFDETPSNQTLQESYNRFYADAVAQLKE